MDVNALIEDANNEVNTRKHPSVREFRDFINPIAKASGQGSIDDEIVSINEYRGELTINMIYEVRCCSQSRKVVLPMSVLLDADPVNAAHRFRVQTTVDKAKNDMNAALREAVSASLKYDNAKAELQKYL